MEGFSQERRDALWKWRWLGWRKSTPAFKLSLMILALAAAWLVLTTVRG
jgi:hypothetical protein